MKNILFLLLLFPFSLAAQFSDDFSDGDFTQNPAWSGTAENFTVNAALQLQSNAADESVSYLCTPSEAISDAVWEFWVKINQNPSSSNYSAVYIVADGQDFTNFNGYFVKIGGETGTADKITLYLQQGTKQTSLIAGRDTVLTGGILELNIKIIRDTEGNFTLFTKKPAENEFVMEGMAKNLAVTQSAYFGVWYKNTKTAGKNFFFDSFAVTGDAGEVPPTVELPESGDIVWNEVMFDAPAGSQEYLEIANLTDKTFDASKLCFAVRNSAGKLGTVRHIPAGTYLLPNEVLAFCANPDSVKNHYNLAYESKIAATAWTSLNNESATLVLFTAENRDTVVLDEFTYNANWHHAMIKNRKGVSLEKINPALPSAVANSWRSAASEVNYGTPGYRNSQFREIGETAQDEKFVTLDPSAFSPDNDGIDDVLFIRYDMGGNGFTANIAIYSATGVKLRQIAYNALLQAEGFFTWDGSSERGSVVNAGVYVLVFEAFNAATGAKKAVKLPVAVSTR